MRWLLLQRIDETLQLDVVSHAKEKKIYPLTCFYVFIFSLSICVYITLKERGETKIKHKEVGAVIEGHTHRKKKENKRVRRSSQFVGPMSDANDL
jgi:hypothetical protein